MFGFCMFGYFFYKSLKPSSILERASSIYLSLNLAHSACILEEDKSIYWFYIIHAIAIAENPNFNKKLLKMN